MKIMNLQPLLLDVQAYTQHCLPQYIEELRELCAIDAGSYHKAGLDEVAQLLATRLRRLPMDVTIVEREQWGNDLFGTIHGEGHGKIVLLGHTDTVYPVGTAAARPLRVEGNTAYGPGVIDIKGGVLSAIYAIEALLALGYHAFGELCLLCVSDEEINISHSDELIHHILQGSQAVLVLEVARENGDIVSARKGSARYTLKARGRAAHSGVEMEKGRNAVIEVAHQLLQFQSLNGWREGITISPNMIAGGTAANTVPEDAEVCIDVRFLNHQDLTATEERWYEMMNHHVIPDVELTLDTEPNTKEPMVCTPESMHLVHLAQEVAGMLGFTIGHVLTGGSGDAGYASQIGIPVIDGLGPIGGLDHSPSEYLQLDSVAPRTAMLAGLIASVGG